MLDLSYKKFYVPRDLRILGSPGNLINGSGFRLSNKTKNGFIFFFDPKRKKLTRLWTFPNYFVGVVQENVIWFFLKEKIPHQSKIFLNSFAKTFYKNLYAHAFQNYVTLHFVGVGYKVFF